MTEDPKKKINDSSSEAKKPEEAKPENKNIGDARSQARADIERQAETENAKIPQDISSVIESESESESEPESESESEVSEEASSSSSSSEEVAVKEDSTEDQESSDPTERLKAKMQKRIGKEVAKRKTAQEELQELRAENERLRKLAEKEVKESKSKEDKDEPTDKQIAQALAKARADGDTNFEMEILNYMVERKGNEIADAKIRKIQEEERAKAKATEQQAMDWQELVADYTPLKDGKVDTESDLNLQNQNGLLYKTALALYKDPELKRQLYNDPDKIRGFRRAVSDAYKEINEGGLIKSKPSKKEKQNTKTRKAELASPSSETEETETSSSSQPSRTEKVVDEIRNRKKFLRDRSKVLA